MFGCHLYFVGRVFCLLACMDVCGLKALRFLSYVLVGLIDHRLRSATTHGFSSSEVLFLIPSFKFFLK